MSKPNLEEIHVYNIDLINRQIYAINKSDDDGDINTASTLELLKNLHILDRDKGDITIHLYSFGGNWYCGMLLYDAISNCQNHVSIICYGACMSAATIFLQAADKRISTPNCVFMFHEGQQSLSGTYKQVQSSMIVDKISRDNMIKIYAERCKNGESFTGKSLNHVKSYIRGVLNRKEDWYLTAEDALNYGFIDEIRT